MITLRTGIQSSALRRTVFAPRLAPLQAKRPIDILNPQRRFSHYVAKPGSHWTLNDLESYNIHLEQQSALRFFGVQQLPEPAVDPELLNVRDARDMVQDHHAQLITLLDLAMVSRRDSGVPDFAVELFNILGYTDRGRVACRRLDHYFVMCGKRMRAKTHVCLMESPPKEIRLLLREDRRIRGPIIAQAQLVAAAVAAFTDNNVNRMADGRDLLAEKVMPGIIMVGTTPTFFKIPITETLTTHIRDGTYPPDITTVTFCQPPVPRPQRWEGMMPLDGRRQILRCYEAFKTVVGI
ncbi:hypothetical protein BDZ89DRAFT_1162141 [Hymenopellis radicata]|nr:hypothetical protein BDZ89DRAFT_1162141 [Hymenopellis radicata]